MAEYMSSETVYVYIFTYVISIIILWLCLLFLIPRYCSRRRQDIHSPGNASPTEVEVSNALHGSVQVVDPSVHGSDATVLCSGDQEEPEEGQPSAPEMTATVTVPCSGDQEEPEEGQPSAPEMTPTATMTIVRDAPGQPRNNFRISPIHYPMAKPPLPPRRERPPSLKIPPPPAYLTADRHVHYDV